VTNRVSTGAVQRVCVVGTSGSGKTTLAGRLACHLGIPHIELDALHWDPDWTPAPDFRQRVAEALSGETWSTDGNYSKVRDIVWQRADTVVWLDYSLPRVMWQVTTRTLRRSLRQEELWGTNRETLREAFFGRDSIIWFALKTYRRRKKRYPLLFSQPEYAHLQVVHLQSPHQAQRWLEGLGRSQIAPAEPQSSSSGAESKPDESCVWP
jgi:adenylate kinase family enzyme